MVFNKKGNRWKWILWLVTSLLLSLLASIYAVGRSYNYLITPANSAGQLRHISGDGWVEDGGQILLPDLSSRGNRLDLVFNHWRPAAYGPAHVKVSVCGEPASEFIVTESSAKQRIFIRGECNPRLVQFNISNSFVPSEKDKRKLGVRLISASVTSRLGIPLVSSNSVFLYAGAMFVVAWLFALLALRVGLNSKGVISVFFLMVVAGAWLLSVSSASQITKVYSWWLILVSLFVGMHLAASLYQRSFGPSRLGNSDTTNGDWPVASYLAVAIVICGGLIRFYGLNFGLPSNFHPDEVPKVNAIGRMIASHSFDPQYFLHPSLLLYSSYFVNTVFHWFGMEGSFLQTAFLAGRTVSALAGTISIYLVYVIGKRLYGSSTGIIAAVCLAGFPLHVTCSRYMKEDALLVCMVLWCVATMLKAVQEGRVGYLLFAGLIAGFSASSKYTGMLSAAIIIAAPFLRSKSLIPDWSWIKYAVLALCLIPVGFVICTPYSVITYSAFIKGFGSEQHHMMRGHTVPIDPWSQYWMYHFWRSLVPGMQLIPTLVAVAGAGILLWRRRLDDLFIVALIALFYLPSEWVKAKPEPQPERYVLACLPFMAICIGEFVRVLRASSFRLLAPIVILLVTVIPIWRSIELASEIKNDTRIQLADWMVANLQHGAKVVVDWKPYAPRFHRGEFQSVYLIRSDILEKMTPSSMKQIGQAGNDYLVLSSLFYDRYMSQPLADPAMRQRFRDIFERVPVIKQIKPKYGTYGFNNPTLTLFSLKEKDFDRLEQEISAKRRGEIEMTSNEKLGRLEYTQW